MARNCNVPGLASSTNCLLARIIWYICTGWILNSLMSATTTTEVNAAPVIDRDTLNRNINRANFQDSNNNSATVPLGDKIETGSDPNALPVVGDRIGHGSPPELILPDFLLQTTDQPDNHGDWNTGEKMDGEGGDTLHNTHSLRLQGQDLEKDLVHNQDLIETKANYLPEIEYEAGLVLRCAAKGIPRPNLTWELDDEHLPLYATMTGLTYSHPIQQDGEDVDNDNKNNNLMENDNDSDTKRTDLNVVYWVDLKLPKLNNAFYGRLRCRAENVNGLDSWEVQLIHNANSSFFMKLARIIFSIALIVLAILSIKLTQWVNAKNQERLYDKLPPQDLEIIHKFKTGLDPPPPSPSSSIVQTNAIGCVPGIEISVTYDGDVGKEGYRLVKEQSSSPDLERRLMAGERVSGSTTPTSCKSVHVLDFVNNWTNYVPYDDKFELSSQHFKVDFNNMIENGSYGMVYSGKIRNDLTMEWSKVFVKCGKSERDDNFLLESILTELKILASLPKPHFSIVNLRGAYTKMLYKRQAYIFVDFCENGSLANFIDLNRKYFQIPGSSQDLNTLPLIPSNNNSVSQTKSDNNEGIMMKPLTEESGQIASSSFQLPSNVEKVNEGKQPQTFGLKELFAWSWQIADGMNFLHKNRVIHGNLSTANVFLTAGLSAKIGNIGLTPSQESSRCIDETTRKWLTVPSFGYQHFSKKSDVWDYGRVLWELYSLREQKMPDKETILQFLRTDDEDEDGEIEVPDFATSEVFELMLCCWNENGTLCPEFDFLTRAFKQIYRNIFAPVQVVDPVKEEVKNKP